MQEYKIKVEYMSDIRKKAKEFVWESRLDVPCLVTTVTDYMRFGKYPVEYHHTFEVDRGRSSLGLVSKPVGTKMVHKKEVEQLTIEQEPKEKQNIATISLSEEHFVCLKRENAQYKISISSDGSLNFERVS